MSWQRERLATSQHLHCLPPSFRLGFALALFGLGYIAPVAVQVLMVAWLSTWLLVYTRIPLSTYVTLQGFALSFLALSLPAIVIQITTWEQVAGQPLGWGLRWGHFYFYVSEQSWPTALALLARAGALNSCLLLIIFTLPVTELVRVLKTWGCPELLTDLALLMYRFVFLLMANLRELLTAQKVRGGYGGSWRKTLQSISLAASQLLVRSLSQLREFSLALECRGYDGSFQVYRIPNPYQSFCWRYGLEAMVGYSLLLGLTGWHYGTQG